MKKHGPIIVVVLLLIIAFPISNCSKSNNPTNGDPPDTTQPPLDTTELQRPDSTGRGTLTFAGALNTISNGLPLCLAKKGDILYAGDNYKILAINVSNPTIPSVMAIFPSSSDELIYGLTTDGNYLYAVIGNKLWIFNISNPVAPAEVSQLTLSSSGARGIAVYRDRAYIGRKGMGISIINISNKSAPVEIARYADYPTNCLVMGAGRLYMGKEYGIGSPTSQRIWQMSVADRDTLVEISRTDPLTGNSAFDIDYIYGHLFEASGKTNISANTGTINIFSKTGLLQVCSRNTQYVCTSIAVEGNYVYVVDRDQASGASNLYIYEAFNPITTYEAHRQTLPSPGKDVLVSNGNIYILCTNRLVIYRHSY